MVAEDMVVSQRDEIPGVKKLEEIRTTNHFSVFAKQLDMVNLFPFH